MGAMPRHVPASSVSHMPPTLLIHGARDRVVPISRMYEVASLLDDIGATYEVKVYMDQAHNLAGAAHTDSVLTVADFFDRQLNGASTRSEEHTSELQSLMRISYAVFCLNKKTKVPNIASLLTTS